VGGSTPALFLGAPRAEVTCKTEKSSGMADKMSMSLDDIVKNARAEKAASKPGGPKGNKETTGGKAKKNQKKERSAPYDKEKKEKKERKEAPPSKSLYVGNIPFTAEASALEAQLGAVATCTVELKMRKNGKSAGFAIATFADVEAATKAMETLKDTEFEGRKMLIRFGFDNPPSADTV
jgi:RNA recognition motif-containing protein